MSNSTTTILTRSVIENDLKDFITPYDKDEETDLELFCYNKCSSEDSELLKQCRGVILYKDHIIARSFPYTEEFVLTDSTTENITKVFTNSNFSTYSVYDAHEGALIRIFNFEGKWYLSTHRKLDAFNSKWSSQYSFGECFKQALENELTKNETLKNVLPSDETETIVTRFTSILNPQNQYMFIIRNNKENRIVCHPPETPTIYHVGTMVGDTLNTDDTSTFLPKPTKHTFNTVDNMLNYVKTVDCYKMQGIIVFTDSFGTNYKIMNEKYNEYFMLRNNQPSLKYRYLELRNDKEMVKRLKELYPDMTNLFEYCENVLAQAAIRIYNTYVNRAIKKMYIIVSKEEHYVIKQCHQWHLEDRNVNKISLPKVTEILNKQSASVLIKIIRNFKK